MGKFKIGQKVKIIKHLVSDDLKRYMIEESDNSFDHEYEITILSKIDNHSAFELHNLSVSQSDFPIYINELNCIKIINRDYLGINKFL